MALRLAECEPQRYCFAITPTGRELPPVVEHWKRLEGLLGAELVRVPAPGLVELIVRQKALPNWRMRWCTRLVKIEPFMSYAAEMAPAVCYVGIRADEVGGQDGREGTDWQGINGVTQDLPLVRWGWGLEEVKNYLGRRGVTIPVRTDCDFCFFQRLGEWWRLWRDYPERWREAEALEEFTGHTFRSAQRDTWPAGLKGLRLRFEAGEVPAGAAQGDLGLEVERRAAMCAWCAR
jgi:3'-phosphoadenosine 5'-phosphosulfate sulfotransferase (PAPS reductase)/FAD synthetase